MRRTTRVIGGTLAGVLQILIALGLQIVLMPLILQTAGQETLGVYAILLQIIGYLALLDLGLSTALGRSLSQATHDPDRFRRLMTAGFYFLCLIGGLYALAGIGLAFSLRDLFHLSGLIAQQTQAAMLLLAVWGFVRFPVTLFATALLTIQDLSLPPLISAISNILRMVLAVMAVRLGLGVIGLSAASIVAEAFLSVWLIIRFTALRPQWTLQMNNLDRALLREQLGFGLQAFWGNLTGRVIFSTDNIIVGNLYGAAKTSIYYSTQTPVYIAYSLVFRLADNAMPGINELWAKQDWDRLRDIFLRLQRLTLLMVTPIVLGGWFYLGTTIQVWVGSSQFGGQGLTLGLILFAGLTTARYVPQVFLYASGDLRRFSQIVTWEAISNLALSYGLGIWLGPVGVAFATLLAHLPTAIYLQWRVSRELKIIHSEWLIQTISPAALAALPTGLAAGLLANLFPPTSWATLALHGGLIAAVHLASVYWLGLSRADRLTVNLIMAALRPKPDSEQIA